MMTKFISLENFDDTNVELVDRDIEYSSMTDSPLSDSADAAFRSTVADTEALGKANAILEDNQDTIEDLPESSRLAIEVAVESIRERLLGTKARQVVAVESFTSKRNLQLAIEENKNIISRAWDAIVKFFKSIYEWVVGLFKSKKNINQKIDNEANKVIEKIKSTTDVKSNAKVETVNSQLPSSGGTIVFESDKYNRITGSKNSNINLTIFDSPFLNYYEGLRNNYRNSTLDVGEMSVFVEYLSKNNKNIIRDFNKDKRSKDGVLNLSFEYSDEELGRGVTVSPFGIVQFKYPDPANVEYTVSFVSKNELINVEKQIKKSADAFKKVATHGKDNVEVCLKNLEKITKTLDAGMPDRSIDKDKVNEMVSSTKAILSFHSKLLLDMEKDMMLYFDLINKSVSVSAFIN